MSSWYISYNLFKLCTLCGTVAQSKTERFIYYLFIIKYRFNTDTGTTTEYPANEIHDIHPIVFLLCVCLVLLKSDYMNLICEVFSSVIAPWYHRQSRTGTVKLQPTVHTGKSQNNDHSIPDPNWTPKANHWTSQCQCHSLSW